MRSRGDKGTSVFTAETMAERFGVVKGSYDTVAVPVAKAFKVRFQSPEDCDEYLLLG